MNIYGEFGTAKSDDEWANWWNGAFEARGSGKADGNDGTTRFRQTLLTFSADRNWTGSTSEPSNGYSGLSGGNEARPVNFTIRIWRRIA